MAATAAAKPPPADSVVRAQERFGRVLAAPAAIVLLVTTTIPLCYLVVTSLYSRDLSNPGSGGFVGLANYVEALGDGRFWHSLGISLIYTTSTVALQLVVGMLLALAIHRIKRGAWLLRVMAIMPILLAPVVVGLVWRTLLLSPEFGIVGFVAEQFGVGIQNWLGEPVSALVWVIVIHTWQWTPFCFLVFSASLAAMPVELEEAARLDRASPWKRFWYVTFPLLRQAIVIVAIIRTVIALSAFDALFAATGGGPGTATEILNLYVYRISFTELRMGYGSALAVILMAITFIIAAVFFRLRGARR
ncbi:MAG: ABC transporter permease subunit [Streptosporangiales bacterium]|nr:ABC transporter permease subunit [Streptosporangiales bacterium]